MGRPQHEVKFGFCRDDCPLRRRRLGRRLAGRSLERPFGPVTAARVSRAARDLRRALRDEAVEVPPVDAWAAAPVRQLVRAARSVLDGRPHVDRARRLARETATARRRFERIRGRTRLRDWFLRRTDEKTIERLQADVRKQIDHVERLHTAGLLAPQPRPRHWSCWTSRRPARAER